jgi:RNA polymerase sigma factor (sigma-70 family)
MDDVIKLVRAYRFASAITERARLADQIFPLIGSDLKLFVFSKLRRQDAEDALNEVLMAIAKSLQNFRGDSTKAFWAWAYRIARNKLNDKYRKQANEKLLPMSPEDLLQMIETVTHDAPITPGVKHDLEYAINLLNNSKPECYDFLWNHYVFDLDYADIAADREMTYDGVRMKIGRCLEEAKNLVS